MDVGFVVAERLLYVPSMGYCLILAIIFDHAISQCKQDAVFSAKVPICGLSDNLNSTQFIARARIAVTVVCCVSLASGFAYR